MNQTQGRSKLWLGFGLMCGAVLVWAVWMHFAMSPMLSLPVDMNSAMSGDLDAAMKRVSSVGSIYGSMLMGEALSAIFMIGGILLAAMGLVDYAAEVRRRV